MIITHPTTINATDQAQATAAQVKIFTQLALERNALRLELAKLQASIDNTFDTIQIMGRNIPGATVAEKCAMVASVLPQNDDAHLYVKCLQRILECPPSPRIDGGSC